MNGMFGTRPAAPFGQNKVLPQAQPGPAPKFGGNTFLGAWGKQQGVAPAPAPAYGGNTFLGSMGQPSTRAAIANALMRR